MARIQLGGRAATFVMLMAIGGCGGGAGSSVSQSDSNTGTGDSSTGSGSGTGTATTVTTSSGTDSGSTTPTTTAVTTSEGTSTTAATTGTSTGTTEPIEPQTTGSTTDETTGSTTDETTGDTSTSTTTDTSGSSTGDSTSTTDGTTGEPIECGALPVTYRDLKPLHPDFGCHMFGNGARPGLVMPTIGMDQKPVYNPNVPPPPPGWNGSNPQITSGASFMQWYNTVVDVNFEVQGELMLTEIMPGIWSFNSNMFYPLTNLGFGNNITPNWANETYPAWNGSFTTEIHTNFYYEQGQSFSFSGDDDVWVFIDGQLAMDLGGLHGPVQGTINLDTLGLTDGVQYSLDVFHAERCESGSNFRIDTSISCFVPQ